MTALMLVFRNFCECA